jgi:hypothetical protein
MTFMISKFALDVADKNLMRVKSTREFLRSKRKLFVRP